MDIQNIKQEATNRVRKETNAHTQQDGGYRRGKGVKYVVTDGD